MAVEASWLQLQVCLGVGGDPGLCSRPGGALPCLSLCLVPLPCSHLSSDSRDQCCLGWASLSPGMGSLGNFRRVWAKPLSRRSQAGRVQWQPQPLSDWTGDLELDSGPSLRLPLRGWAAGGRGPSSVPQLPGGAPAVPAGEALPFAALSLVPLCWVCAFWICSAQGGGLKSEGTQGFPHSTSPRKEEKYSPPSPEPPSGGGWPGARVAGRGGQSLSAEPGSGPPGGSGLGAPGKAWAEGGTEPGQYSWWSGDL